MTEALTIEGKEFEAPLLLPIEEEKKEEEVIEAPVMATPEETLERMQSEEAMIKATMPNFQELEEVKEIEEIAEEVEVPAPHEQYMERLGELKHEVVCATYPEKFTKMEEQLDFLLEAYKECGGDVKEFMGLFNLSKEKTFLDITFVKGTPSLGTNLFVGPKQMTGIDQQELAHASAKKETIEEIVKERENGVLENELAETLLQLYQETLNFHSTVEKEEGVSFAPILMDLYKVEKEKGLPLLGPKLLESQLGWLFRAIERCEDSHWKYDQGLPIALDCLKALKEEKQSVTLMNATKKACELFLGEDWIAGKEKDSYPLKQLLPFIVGYGGFYLIEKSFYEKHASTALWAKDGSWTLLHIVGARELASENQEKGKELLDKASKLIEEKLWSYPFSWNKKNWDEMRQIAVVNLKQVQDLYSEEK